MRGSRKKVIILVLLSMTVLCSCQKEQVEKEEREVTVEVTPEAEESTQNVNTSEYNGDPYQGTVDVYEESMSIYDTLTKEEAVEDLTYFYNRLVERHPAWLDGSIEKTKAVAQLYQESIDNFSDTVTVLELYRCSCEMAAILRDGHTRVFATNDIKIINMADQIEEYGYPKMINQIELSELEERSKELLSYEIDEYREFNLLNSWIFCEDYLALLGVDTQDGASVTFDNGKTYNYDLVSYSEIEDQHQAEDEEEWVSYKIDEEHNLGIFTLKECIYSEEYISVVNEFFEKVNEKGISNIAVDLRFNGGGSAQVADEFVSHLNHKSYMGIKGAMRIGYNLKYYGGQAIDCGTLREDAYSGKVYVLTNICTYSAAMSFGMIIQDNGFGVIVGEASGNLPHCYIDSLCFQMPNSKLGLTISYEISFRIDSNKAEEPLTPDYIVDSSEALEKVYELIGEEN